MKPTECISVIIPAAGMGRRMKSYGPKPLIKIGNSTIIKNVNALTNNVKNKNLKLYFIGIHVLFL